LEFIAAGVGKVWALHAGSSEVEGFVLFVESVAAVINLVNSIHANYDFID
jgi:predicted RNA-binding protein with TRAM domain